VLIYDHTLVLISSRTLFCVYPSKEFLSKFLSSKSPFKICFSGLVRLTARSTAGRAELLCRSTGRSTDMHPCACVHIGRPTSRPRAMQCSLFFLGRPDRSTDRENSLSVWDFGRPARSTAFPTVENPTVGGRPARSTDSNQNLLTDSNSYFSDLIFVGISPNESLGLFNPVFIPYK